VDVELSAARDAQEVADHRAHARAGLADAPSALPAYELRGIVPGRALGRVPLVAQRIGRTTSCKALAARCK
jgi:hypothetical protein